MLGINNDVPTQGVFNFFSHTQGDVDCSCKIPDMQQGEGRCIVDDMDPLMMDVLPLRNLLSDVKRNIVHSDIDVISGGESDEKMHVIRSLREFSDRANQIAFERLLFHIFHYRHEVRDNLFINREDVHSKLLDTWDRLKDSQETSADALSDCNDKEAMENYNTHIRQTLLNDMLSSMIDDFEVGFDRIRQRLEKYLLVSIDDNASTLHERGFEGGEDEDEEEKEQDWECKNDVDLDEVMTKRRAVRIIDRSSYKTHNSSSGLSAELRKIALFHVSCVDESSRGEQRRVFFKRIIDLVQTMIGEDYNANKYKHDLDSVNMFRRRQLMDFANASFE